jgi:hypothetical protein
MPSLVADVQADVKKAEPLLKEALAELASLSNPATDAAIVALVVKVVPGVHFNTTEVLGVMGGVGIASQWVRSKFSGGVQGLAASLGAVLPATTLQATPPVVVNVHPTVAAPAAVPAAAGAAPADGDTPAKA